MIGHHREGNTCLFQHAWGGKREILELNLAALGEQGPYDDARTLLDQAVFEHICNHVAFGAVVDGHLQVEFLCESKSCEDIVRTVGVNLHGQVAVDDGEECLHRDVAIGLILFLRHAFLIFDRIGHGRAKQRRNRHARGGRNLLFGVDIFGVFARCGLHRDGIAEGHFLNAAPASFERGKLPADDVCAAGPGDDGGDAGLPRFFEAGIKGV